MDMFKIPEILAIEHDAIQAELEAASAEGGSTGEAARSLAEMLGARIASEREFVWTRRGGSQDGGLAKIPLGIRGAIALSEDLKARLQRLLAEHKGFVERLEGFRQAALEERKPHYVRFADMVRALLRSEEEVIYPAAVQIGGYLRLAVADPAL